MTCTQPSSGVDGTALISQIRLRRVESVDQWSIRLVFATATRVVSVIHPLRQQHVECKFPHPFDEGGESLGSDALDTKMRERAVQVIEFMNQTFTYGRLAGLR